METDTFIVCGNFIHSTETNPCEFLRDKCLCVKQGKIVFIDDTECLADQQSQHNLQHVQILRLSERQFVIPGFIDTHIHAPQYPNAGKGLDMGLLDWLSTYTFPTEAKFKDLKFAAKAYRHVVSRVLRNGTTTACYYATIHIDATILLCDIIEELGQRALVGKVNMNRNSPDFYIESSSAESAADTRRYIETVRKKQYRHITPVITPRFAISCCDDLLQELGKLAAELDVPIQTHMCETRDEVALVKDIFPDADHYACVYDKAGLLTEKTVLGHCIYLTPEEIELLKKRKCTVSHCPNSNLSIRSGLLDARNLIEHNITVGLGTDVSGGYHPSILDAIRVAVHTSNAHAISRENGYKPLSVREAFGLATLGGAKALSLDKVTGNFEVGKEFDALIIDPSCRESIVDVFDDDTLEDCFDKFLYTGDDRNITEIFVCGRRVDSDSLKGL